MFDDKNNNDDKHLNGSQEPSKAESEAKQDDAKQDEANVGEKKAGKVIPFDTAAEVSVALDEAKDALDEAVDGVKSAFDELKKQLEPFRNGFADVANAIREGIEKAEKKAGLDDNAESDEKADDAEDAKDKDDANENAEPSDAENDADGEAKTEGTRRNMAQDVESIVETAKDASELLIAGIDKIKAYAENVKIDLKGSWSHEFEQFADEKLTEQDYEVDETGKRVVKVDSKFFQDHASEVVPALLRGTAETLLKAFLGEDALKKKENEANAESGEARNLQDSPNADADAEDAAGDQESVEESAAGEESVQKESKYRVEFDFSNSLSRALHKAAADADENAKEESAEEQGAGQSVLVESVKIVEDTINHGQAPVDIQERLEKAAARASHEDDSGKAPEEIEAVDEKHRRILELSKQFEKSMNPDKP